MCKISISIPWNNKEEGLQEILGTASESYFQRHWKLIFIPIIGMMILDSNFERETHDPRSVYKRYNANRRSVIYENLRNLCSLAAALIMLLQLVLLPIAYPMVVIMIEEAPGPVLFLLFILGFMLVRNIGWFGVQIYLDKKFRIEETWPEK